MLTYLTMHVPTKFYLSVAKLQVNALLYLFRKVYVNHDIVYSIIVSMWLGTRFLTFIFSICYYLWMKTVYGTHGIWHLSFDNIMVLKYFFFLNWVSFQAWLIFFPETLKCLVYFSLGLILPFLKTLLYVLCNYIIPKIILYFISGLHVILKKNVLNFFFLKLFCSLGKNENTKGPGFYMLLVTRVLSAFPQLK